MIEYKDNNIGLELNDKLQAIFNQYKRAYKLNTELDVYEGRACQYRPALDIIEFCPDHVLGDDLYEDIIYRSGKNNDELLLVFALLHELKHAIDWYTGILKDEWSWVEHGLYNSDREYHHSCPFEKRADDWAKKELARLKKGDLI